MKFKHATAQARGMLPNLPAWREWDHCTASM